MWGVLIEKAWAKSFSNYSALGLKGGFSNQALKALNGAPTDIYVLKKFTEFSIWVMVASSKDNGFSDYKTYDGFHVFES
jgi:hypothetical protein